MYIKNNVIFMVTIVHLNTYSQYSCIIINPIVDKFFYAPKSNKKALKLIWHFGSHTIYCNIVQVSFNKKYFEFSREVNGQL
jgi:protoheme ferro-lyase